TRLVAASGVVRDQGLVFPQVGRSFQERPTSQGGFAAHPAPLRSGGLLVSPGEAGPLSLFHSWPAPSERPTSQGGFAAHPAPLRSAGLLLPPGPPSSSTRGPLLRSVPRARGDSQLIRLRCPPPGCSSPLAPLRPPLVARSFGASHEPGGIRSSSGSAALRRAAPPPWTPFFFHSWPAPSERPTSQGGFAAHPAPLRSAGLLLPPGPPCPCFLCRLCETVTRFPAQPTPQHERGRSLRQRGGGSHVDLATRGGEVWNGNGPGPLDRPGGL